MAACAVELQVPDMEGSRKGTDPFRVWLDACQYGIGGGLFQAPPLEAAADGPPTCYQVLDLPTWATKGELSADITKCVGSLSRPQSPDGWSSSMKLTLS